MRLRVLAVAAVLALGTAVGASAASQLTGAGFAPVEAPRAVVARRGPFAPPILPPYPAADVEESVGGTLELPAAASSDEGYAQGRTGVIAQSVIGGPSYLAIPIGPGHLVDVCGPADCWRAVSTDAGPARSMLLAGRIADVALGHWRDICGLPAIRGTCRGSWHVVGGPLATLPPTDSR